MQVLGASVRACVSRQSAPRTDRGGRGRGERQNHGERPRPSRRRLGICGWRLPPRGPAGQFSTRAVSSALAGWRAGGPRRRTRTSTGLDVSSGLGKVTLPQGGDRGEGAGGGAHLKAGDFEKRLRDVREALRADAMCEPASGAPLSSWGRTRPRVARACYLTSGTPVVKGAHLSSNRSSLWRTKMLAPVAGSPEAETRLVREQQGRYAVKQLRQLTPPTHTITNGPSRVLRDQKAPDGE